MKKGLKKNPRAWLARNNHDFCHYRLYFGKKPKITIHGEWEAPADEIFCPGELERITGFKLKPGECKRVRIKIEVAK